MTLASLLFMAHGSYENAAQLVLLGIMLEVSKEHTVGLLVFAYLCLFVLFGLVLEIVHFIYRRKYTAAREMWEHIQKLKSQCDAETLLQLMLAEKTALWTGKQWDASVKDKCKA